MTLGKQAGLEERNWQAALATASATVGASNPLTENTSMQTSKSSEYSDSLSLGLWQFSESHVTLAP